MMKDYLSGKAGWYFMVIGIVLPSPVMMKDYLSGKTGWHRRPNFAPLAVEKAFLKRRVPRPVKLQDAAAQVKLFKSTMC